MLPLLLALASEGYCCCCGCACCCLSRPCLCCSRISCLSCLYCVYWSALNTPLTFPSESFMICRASLRLSVLLSVELRRASIFWRRSAKAVRTCVRYADYSAQLPQRCCLAPEPPSARPARRPLQKPQALMQVRMLRDT